MCLYRVFDGRGGGGEVSKLTFYPSTSLPPLSLSLFKRMIANILTNI
jgi:hypothetical protein